MEKTIAKSFGIELKSVHMKLDILIAFRLDVKLPSSVVLAKAGTKNHCRTITKDLWCKYHP